MKHRNKKEYHIKKAFDAAALDFSEGRQKMRENRRRIKKRMSKASRQIDKQELTAEFESDLE